MKKLRLFHFDIKTLGNYGDTLLFELTRQLFESFGDRNAFEIAGSLNLRAPMGYGTVDNINDNFDAILIGGGGLFLRDSNVNERSGWQWNCAIEHLQAFKKPVIVFAVGNNRFPGQEDFDPIFREHLNVLVRKSAFFGLRNQGSVDSIRSYIDPEFRERVVLQPCPTTIAAELCADLVPEVRSEARRFAIQSSLEPRHVAAGYDVEAIHGRIAGAIELLVKDGFTAETISHMRGDEQLPNFLKARGLTLPHHELQDRHDFYEALSMYARLPITIGMRGHAQMIPFGMGSPIISLMAHDKLRYFLEDIGHDNLGIDARDDKLTEKLVSTVQRVHRDGAAICADFALKRRAIFERTQQNLASIYHALTGEDAVGELRPLTSYERAISLRGYHAIMKKERFDRLLRESKRETVAAERARDAQSAALAEKERELRDARTQLGERERELAALTARLQRCEAEREVSSDAAGSRTKRAQGTVRSALRVAKELAQAVRRGDRP
jgi:hypothetical protein